MTESRFFQVINDPSGSAAQISCIAARARAPKFLLCLGSTEVSDIEGISAAGATGKDRRLTPALDAEVLLTGRPLSAGSLPVSPSGVVSPVVITRPCLALAGIAPEVVDCGAFTAPKADHTTIARVPARCLSTGSAMSLDHVRQLFESGRAMGRSLARQHDLLAVAECVPGGTTTALAVLTALGHKVNGYLSGSLPRTEHQRRWQLVKTGLRRAAWTTSEMESNVFKALSSVGDPMQPFVAGVVIGAGDRFPVVLSGGSQMLAVYGVVSKIRSEAAQRGAPFWVVTTKWVAFDPAARTIELASRLKAPAASACPDFMQSRHQGLREYEEGNVKEGAGAGGSLALAYLRGHSDASILRAIDDFYDTLVR